MNNIGTLHGGEPTHAQARCGTNPRRILVVDDDFSIRELGAVVLSASGYQVDTAEDGEAGWEALQTSSYDLLITDNTMPKVSGVELVENMRSARMTLPVVLASGAIPPEALNRDSSLQIAATLLKPFTGDALLGTVKKVLRETDFACEQNEPVPIWQSQPSADALRLR